MEEEYEEEEKKGKEMDEEDEIVDFGNQSPIKDFGNQSPIKENLNPQESVPHMEENLNTQDFANIDLMVTETPNVQTDRSKGGKAVKSQEKCKLNSSNKNQMSIQVNSNASSVNHLNTKKDGKDGKENDELIKTIFTKVI